MLMPSFVTCGQLVGKLKCGARRQHRNLISLPLFPLSKTFTQTYKFYTVSIKEYIKDGRF